MLLRKGIIMSQNVPGNDGGPSPDLQKVKDRAEEHFGHCGLGEQMTSMFFVW